MSKKTTKLITKNKSGIEVYSEIISIKAKKHKFLVYDQLTS